VTAWATGGDVAGAAIKLTSAPKTLTPAFSAGCGQDGSASCALGTLDPSSAQRQLQAKDAVPATATTVTSVQLTATASATGVSRDPQVSATVTVTAPPASSVDTGIAPLTVAGLPYLPGASPTLSPGGNAASLFPSLTPSKDPASAKAGTRKASARVVANTGALPLGSTVIGAQLIGLAVLALAFVLAVARLSIRRRPVPAQDGPGPAADPPRPAQQEPPAPPGGDGSAG